MQQRERQVIRAEGEPVVQQRERQIIRAEGRPAGPGIHSRGRAWNTQQRESQVYTAEEETNNQRRGRARYTPQRKRQIIREEEEPGIQSRGRDG